MLHEIRSTVAAPQIKSITASVALNQSGFLDKHPYSIQYLDFHIMSDPLSLNGSMTCLLQLTQEVSRLSYKRKTLPVGVRDIRAELELLTAVLRSVQDCESANPGSLPGIEDSIRACLSDVQKLDRKLHDIASRSSFLVKFRWNEKKCSKYILVLQRHRAGLNLALNDVQR